VSLAASLRDGVGDAAPGSTSAEAVYGALKEAIVSGRLAPGSTISQNELYQDLAISRTPVREAMRRLQAEGWIEAQANKRVRVASVSANDIEQLFAMRIALEALAVGAALSRMTDDDLAELRHLLDQMRAAVDAHDYAAWEGPHRAYHRALTRGAGDVIGQMCTTLSESTSRYINLYMSDMPLAYLQGETDHVAIFEACVAKDAEAASSLMAKHLARTAIQIVAILDPGHDPVPIRMAVNLVANPSIDSPMVRRAD